MTTSSGVVVNCSGHTPVYRDWYEMLPNKPVYKHRVSAGDTIIVSVTFNSAKGNKYFLVLDDKTHPRESFKASAACPRGQTCQRNSAEVIVEGPKVGRQHNSLLANFGTVHFSEVEVISRSGRIGSLQGNSLWSANKITMAIGVTVLAKPSARSARDTAFSVTYHGIG